MTFGVRVQQTKWSSWRKRFTSAACLAGFLAPAPATADVTWPEEQLLPSFPTPAAHQDLIFLRTPESATEEELVLFASLKGLVNRKQPRIFSYEGDAFAEGPYTWLESLDLTWTEYADNWDLVTKYKSEIKGLVVYDPAQLDTMNLATTLAGPKSALVVAPSLLSTLTEAPYDFPILEDLRGKFDSKLAVYQHLYHELWPKLTHRALVGLSPVLHKASLREYAVALGAAVVWLDPENEAESELLDAFLESMNPGSVYLGWWREEGAGIERGSRHGIATVPSDYSTNLTLHSGMPRTVRVKPVPPKPVLENKIYVAFILSDGDNLQYVEHLMRKLWNDPGRGQVPMGWTVSPAMLDAMPGALDFYHATSTENDNLISGPSGWGYAYPNFFPSQEALERYLSVTDDYASRAGLRVVTVWNTITGSIDPDVGASYANHAPSLLGLTAQNTGGGLTIYDESLPGFALSCNYCTGEQAMRDHIASAAEGWDGSSPRFILIQAQPWQDVRPTSFLNVKNSLGEEYRVIRPDNWFQLLRQANGLPIEPKKPLADDVYRIVNKESGKCLTTFVVLDVGPAVTFTDCENSDAQLFRVTRLDAGYVKISPQSSDEVVLTVATASDDTSDPDDSNGPDDSSDPDDSTEPGAQQAAKVVLASDLEDPTQQWQPVWEAGEDYYLIARHSDRCLEALHEAPADPAAPKLNEQDCSTSDSQRFVFADPTWPEDPEPPLGDPEPPVEGPGEDPGTDVGAPSTGDKGGCSCSTVSLVLAQGRGGLSLFGAGLALLWTRRRRGVAQG